MCVCICLRTGHGAGGAGIGRSALGAASGPVRQCDLGGRAHPTKLEGVVHARWGGDASECDAGAADLGHGAVGAVGHNGAGGIVVEGTRSSAEVGGEGATRRSGRGCGSGGGGLGGVRGGGIFIKKNMQGQACVCVIFGSMRVRINVRFSVHARSACPNRESHANQQT